MWKAVWDASNEYLEKVTEEESVGTISDDDDVDVTAVVTSAMFDAVTQQARLKEVSGTTYSVEASVSGYLIRCTSGSATTVTFPATLPVSFHAMVVQEGAGAVTVQTAGTDTLNGTAAGTLATAGQYGSIYVYQHTEGTWIALQ